jgi:hypothetical protein
MRRRDFIGLAGAVALQPFAANAQQMPRRLAFVHSGIPADRLTESGGPFWVRRFYEALRGSAISKAIISSSNGFLPKVIPNVLRRLWPRSSPASLTSS